MSRLQHFRIDDRDALFAGQGESAVVVLHGAGATAAWMADETGWPAHAIANGFLTVIPEGTPTHRDRPAKFLTNPKRWNDASPPAREWVEAPDDVRFLDRLCAELKRSFGVQRVFLTGFSNGAGMTFHAAAMLPGRFAAIAPVAGHFWGNGPVPPTPTFYIIGNVDPLIPLLGGEVTSPWRRLGVKPSVRDSLDRWAMGMGLSAPPTIERLDDIGERWTYDDEVSAEVIDGLGHHWPGGLGRLSERYGGPPSGKVNATARIWNYFASIR